MAGGGTGRGDDETFTDSVLALIPSATSWSFLAPLPRPLYRPKASIVGNRLWLAGGERLTVKLRDRPLSDQVDPPTYHTSTFLSGHQVHIEID